MGFFNPHFRRPNPCFPLLRDVYGDPRDVGDHRRDHGDHGGRGDHGVSRVSCACGVPSGGGGGHRGRRGVRCRSHLLRGLSPPPPFPGLFPSEDFKSLICNCSFRHAKLV